MPTAVQIAEMAGAGALTAGLAAGGAAYAALWPQSQLFGPVVVAGRDPREVALTYDDGPNDAGTLELLEVLARHDVRATFFCIGKFVRQRPDLVRAVRAAGHLVGNHTETHPWLSWQSPARIREEMTSCNKALEDALGEPIRLMRPPHGARRPAVFQVAKELGLTVVNWNVTAFDWHAGLAPELVHRNVARGVAKAHASGRGANVLLHDGWDVQMGADRAASIAATDRLLGEWKSAGLRVVTVDRWV